MLRATEWSRELAREALEENERAASLSLAIQPRFEQYRLTTTQQTVWGSGNTTTNLSPKERLDALLGALEKLDGKGFQRSAQQKTFHKAFVVASLKHIYGRDLHRHVYELLERFHVNEIRPDVIVCAIRRAGKTFAVALFAAAFISTQPGVELVVYSTAKRASRKLQALIYKMVTTLADGPEVVEVFNQEELVVKCGNTTSKVISLPSSVEISFLSPFLLLLLLLVLDET